MQENPQAGLVSFVGAGPGDPELLTIKGRDAIARADLVLFAGSLVPREVVACARPGATVVDSAPLTLEESHARVRQVALASGLVARVHTGDPSLYGALREQAALLDADGIPWRVIPGVTAACAAAAAAGVSFSIPGVSQSLILCRAAGRTPVPEAESLAALAAHRASMAVYLSAAQAGRMAQQLGRELAPETPVLCAQRVGWPDQRLVWTTLARLVDCVAQNGFDRQTIFLVLPGELTARGARSRLYAPDFGHGWRREKAKGRPGEDGPCAGEDT
ncbi:precorrin-4 C(11)-methyltransferase [Desulfovibrio sp.]|uniref:precorrin-4 C(11)-methyltransferase n=1 Tax=Desulfovibrio sp. TaxID=885 RepID=UPI0026256D54|nr:precorrin-4 C(11)-methyltransferase [Desulfovibrio sp.]